MLSASNVRRRVLCDSLTEEKPKGTDTKSISRFGPTANFGHRPKATVLDWILAVVQRFAVRADFIGLMHQLL